ncbi:hypothetical protein BU15DRAFT_66159 [Melanogaster broomeanus]|nr:hypothetical protein BU15DRAFT_66159 [Melanogaster broomeanus]
MSSLSKSTTAVISTASIDWAHIKTPELNSDIKDSDEVTLAKAKERRQRKVEKKCQEDEEQRRREEEERHLREEQEAEAECKRREVEQREREEMQRKATEANKKRQREEAEAGLSGTWALGILHSLHEGRVPCEPHATSVWHRGRSASGWEMHAPGVAKGKGKAKEVPTSPRQGEKKKRVCKAKAQQDDEVEIVEERKSGAGLSQLSLDRLVFVIEEMSDQMGELAQAHRESTQAHRESTQASRKARRAFEVFVDEAAICGMPEESADESTERKVTMNWPDWTRRWQRTLCLQRNRSWRSPVVDSLHM